MIINFKDIEQQIIPNFKGGEKSFHAKMSVDEKNKIINGKLEPGASIGLHTHDTNSEVMFFVSGEGKVVYDGKEEAVEAGLCHYCPQGHSHTLINDGQEDLIFLAVVPEH